MDINILKIASDTKNNKHIDNCTHSTKYKSQICGDEIEIFLIIKDNMVANMKSGSIIYDLAASQGGNAAFTEVDKTIIKEGVKIMGETNILNKLPVSASNLYSKNVLNFISNLYDKETKKVNINLEDEIIEKTLIK